MSFRKSARIVSLVVAAICAASGVLFAQSDLGSISGHVKDPTGSTVPNASITVRNEATGIERSAKTNDAGYYVITNIPPGMYTMSAEATGFKKYSTRANKLDPSSTLVVDADLQVGANTETVEVVANAAPLQSESASVQRLLTRNQIDALELNGRNPIFLAQLQPGVRRSDPLSNFGFGLDSGGFSVNGSRSQENLITFDGAPAIRTRSNGTSIGVADVDSTQEIQVLTAGYAPEYGRSSGGQIRIITRSGARDFHGSLYEYFRHDALNANTWTRNSNPATGSVAPFRYNQYGYNVGGPVWFPGIPFNKDRNKLFWYWGQEWVKYRYTETVTQTVPTDAMRNGDFSELLSPSNPIYGKSVVVYDPNTCPAVGNAGCVPFPNNVIPEARRSANGIALLNAYPASNSPFFNGNKNWILGLRHPTDQRKDTLAVDMIPQEKHRFQFRRQNYAYLEYQPLDGGSDRVPKYFNRPNQTNSLDYVWTISPTLVNEALVTVSLDDVYIPLDLSKGLYDRTQYGLNYPFIFPNGKEVPNRIPTVAISNFYELNGGPYPSHSSGPIYTVSDSITKVAGSHTLKAGVVYEKSGENDFDQINVQGVPGGTNNQNGRFQFSDTRTGAGATSGVAAANAALGLFDVYSEIGPRSYTVYRGSMWEMFAQDSWKVTAKLHLDYGLRYSIIVPFHALWGNMDVFDRRFYDPTKAVQQNPKTGYVIPGSGDRYNGMVIPGSGFPDSAKGRVGPADSGQFNNLFRGLPNYYSQIQYGQVQPRFGIAYQLNNKTVVRAGAGRFYTRLGVSDSVFLGGNPPFQPIVSVSNGNVDNPGGGAQNQFPLTVTTQSLHFKNPEAWNWNFTVQRELPFSSVLEVGYVGRRGLHLQRESDINQVPAGTLLDPANAGLSPDYFRPFKGYAIIRETDNVSSSMYNALQVNWTRRFAHGLMFGAAYTFGKSMDAGSSQRDIIPNAYDAHMMWGPSSFDTRHQLVINYIYELPFFRGGSSMTSKLLGGWQISGISQFQTGRPYAIGASNDYAGVGELANMDGNPSGTIRTLQFWNIKGDPRILKQFSNSANDSNQWFAVTSADGSPIFTPPAPGTFVTERVRNRVYGPGFQNWNLGVFKRFQVNERTGFQFRAEAFNFLNHPNWDNPDINPTSKTFGKVNNKISERQMQLSLRFYF